MASHIELADDFVYYFGLYLVKKEDGGDNSSKYFGKEVKVFMTDETFSFSS